MKCNVLEEEIELQVAIRASRAARVERNANPHHVSYRCCITTTAFRWAPFHTGRSARSPRERWRNPLISRTEQEMKIKEFFTCSQSFLHSLSKVIFHFLFDLAAALPSLFLSAFMKHLGDYLKYTECEGKNFNYPIWRWSFVMSVKSQIKIRIVGSWFG